MACTSLFCFLSVFADNALTQTVSNITARTTHESAENNLLLDTDSINLQNIELNTPFQLDVKLLSDGLPVASANIDWQISQTITSSRQGAYFVINAGQFPTLTTQPTDANGSSVITINTGEYSSVYSITASASISLVGGGLVTLSQTFVVNAGIESSVKSNTPEKSIASTLDTMCPKLEENENELNQQQQALLDRCNAIQLAVSEGKTVEVSNVLRQISPEEVAVQSDIGTRFSAQQISNVASRLQAVRRGTSQLSFNNFAFRYGGQAIPMSYLLNSLVSGDEEKSMETGALKNNRLGIFASGNVSIGDRATTDKEDGFEFDSYGVTAGADYRVNANRFIGAAVGFSKSEVMIADEHGEMDATGISLSLYINQYIDRHWYVDGVINIGNNKFDMQRNINFDLTGSSVNRTATSSTNGSQQGVSFTTGYEMQDGALSAIIFGSLNYTKLGIDSFTETGAQELNLRIDKQTIDTTSTSVNAQIQYTHSSRRGVFIPFVGFGWVHEFDNSADSISGAFSSDEFDSEFDISTEQSDSNYFTNSQGITAIFPRGVSAYIKIENIIGKEFYKTTNVSFGGRMELQF